MKNTAGMLKLQAKVYGVKRTDKVINKEKYVHNLSHGLLSWDIKDHPRKFHDFMLLTIIVKIWLISAKLI